MGPQQGRPTDGAVLRFTVPKGKKLWSVDLNHTLPVLMGKHSRSHEGQGAGPGVCSLRPAPRPEPCGHVLAGGDNPALATHQGNRRRRSGTVRRAAPRETSARALSVSLGPASSGEPGHSRRITQATTPGSWAGGGGSRQEWGRGALGWPRMNTSQGECRDATDWRAPWGRGRCSYNAFVILCNGFPRRQTEGFSAAKLSRRALGHICPPPAPRHSSRVGQG